MKNEHLGKRFICVSNNLKRNFNNIKSIKKLNDISGTNGFIIKYIYESKYPIYQKDLEKEFSITRSTCSKIISLMEKKNLIIRQSVSNDARLKQIVLTDKSKELMSGVDGDIIEFEKSLSNGFTEEELDMFFDFLNRLKKNLEVQND